MKIQIVTKGLDNILKELDTFEKKTNQSIDNVVRNAAIFCSGEAKKNISRKYPE